MTNVKMLTMGLVIVLACGAIVSAVDTIQIYNGATLPDSSTYSSTASTWINSGNPTWNGGTNGIMRVGFQSGGASVFRSIIRYGYLNYQHHGVDLGFSDSDIVSARLIVTTDTAFEGAGDCELRVLNESDEEWAELYSTWNQRRTDIPENWADGFGTGIGTNFGSVIDTISWTNTGGNTGPLLTQLEFDLTGAALDVVKNWVSGNDTTDTFVLKAAAESGTGNAYLDMYSEQSSTMSYRPILEISYVPEPATMAIMALGGLFLARKRKA